MKTVTGSRAAVNYSLLILFSIVMMWPFVWMMLTSVKPYAETITLPMKILPGEWRFDNFTEVVNKMNFGLYYLNTITMTLLTIFVELLFCAMAAYAFARLKFPGRDIIFFLLLSVFMVPSQMTIIPKYKLMITLGWVDTMAALVIPNIFSIYGVFFLRQFFLSQPRELEEAAKIDGCSLGKVFVKISLPQITNALLALGVFHTLWTWNDLLWPLVATSSDKTRVLAVGMATLSGQHTTLYNLVMAAACMSMLPMVILFIVCQKQFISGIAMSGIKG